MFKALDALGVAQVPHRRIAGLYGGQPVATVVLVSALAGVVIALGRLLQVAYDDRRLSLEIKASPQVCVVTSVLLVTTMLVFIRLYVTEYAWAWQL
jgi:hypothetical protein